VLSDDAFLLQGRHAIDVRSRLRGDWLSEDMSPAHLSVLIDSVPPELHPKRSDDKQRLELGGFDIVSAPEALVYSWLDSHGKRTGWTSDDSISVDDARAITDDGRRLFQVWAKDEAGNVGQAAVDLTPLLGFHGRTTSPPPPGGCGCTVGGADTSTPRGPLLLVAFLALVWLWRRPRALLTIALIGVALHAAGCGCDDKVLQCVVDDDCSHMKCDPGQVPQCMENKCVCTPDVPPGDTGRFSSMSLIGPDAYVAAYNTTYGDLMIGHVTPPGVIKNWDFVDGVPDESPEINGSHVRSGIQSDKGDDVGRYTSIASTPTNEPVMAYYDKTSGGLKFASFGVIRWRSHTVDKGDTKPTATNGDDVGRWASLTLDKDGTPGIAYTAIVHKNTQSGMPESQLRWAQAKVKNPQSSSDWKIMVVDSRILGTGGPPEDGGTPSPRPSGSPSPAPSAPPDVLLPEAIAIMSAAARKSDGTPGIAYYDRTRGNLRYVEWVKSANAWSMPMILDGEVMGGVDTGDVGAYPSLTYDTMDVAHIAYTDATRDNLLYIDSMNKTPEIIDDGYRAADEKTLDGIDSPVYHLVGDSSSIQIVNGRTIVAYQDSTVLELRVAQKDLMTGKWSTARVAGHEMPFKGAYGFYACLRGATGKAVVSSYGINQQLDTPLYFVEVFSVDLGLIM
jgi:MYXO-CTERM domain-containing protein